MHNYQDKIATQICFTQQIVTKNLKIANILPQISIFVYI